MAWIKCSNGMMLNTTNIIGLKANKNTHAVTAECVGGRTIEIEHCKDREEALGRIEDIVNGDSPASAPKKKKATNKKVASSVGE